MQNQNNLLNHEQNNLVQTFLRLNQERNKGCLIHGPPGVGKTFVCEAIMELYEARGKIVVFPKSQNTMPRETMENW